MLNLSNSISRDVVWSESKRIMTTGVPLVASQLVYALSGFVGTIMVAQLGEEALAASVLVSLIWATLTVLFFGILNAVGILVSHQFGAKNNREITRIMGQSFILGILLAIVLAGLLQTMPFFLLWSTPPPAVLTLAVEYMHSLLWTVPGLVMVVICEQFLAGLGRSKTVMLVSLLVVPLEIFIIYILIFGKLGLPTLGIAGIGYGLATSFTLTAIGLGIYLQLSKHFKQYKIFSEISRIQWLRLKELIVIGIPMGFMHVIEVSTFAFATFWIGHFGTTMLAAHQIALQYLGTAITIVFGMSQAVTIQVGHAVGRQNLLQAKIATIAGMLINFCCVLLIALLMYFAPTLLLRLDMDIHQLSNLPLIATSTKLLMISAVLLVFDNFRIIGFGALRGLKDTQFPMYASLVSFWLVGLSCAYIFGIWIQGGGPGIWWGLTLGIIAGAVIMLTRLVYLFKTIDITKILDHTNV